MTSDALFFTQENRMYAAKALVYTSYNANRNKAKQMKMFPVPKTFPTFCIFIFQLSVFRVPKRVPNDSTVIKTSVNQQFSKENYLHRVPSFLVPSPNKNEYLFTLMCFGFRT